MISSECQTPRYQHSTGSYLVFADAGIVFSDLPVVLPCDARVRHNVQDLHGLVPLSRVHRSIHGLQGGSVEDAHI